MMKNHYLFWSIKRARNGGYLIHDDADQSDYIFADVGALCAWLAENLDPSDNVAREAKQATEYAKWRAECDAKRRKADFARDCQAAIREIAAGHNDPRGLAQSIIDKLEKTK